MLNMCRYKVGCDLPGKYRVVLDSDAWEFGGHGRVRSPNLSGGKHEYNQERNYCPQIFLKLQNKYKPLNFCFTSQKFFDSA